ncbi:MAG TPA: hypothetical protein VIU87_10295, partial [Mycobacterium sp.]
MAGARAREVLRRILVSSNGAEPAFVPRSAAVAAYLAGQQAGSHARGVVLTCDIAAHGVTASLCRVGGAGVLVIDADSATDARGTGGGLAFDNAALAAPTVGVLSEHARAALRLALHAAIRSGERRADLVLKRAAELTRYEQTPVFEAVSAEQRITLNAGDVMQMLGPVVESVGGTLGRLLERNADVLPEVTAVAVLGGLGALPPVRRAVVRALGTVLPTPRRMETEVVARGALLFAEGNCALGSSGPDSITVITHRLLAGRLVEDSVMAVRAGDPQVADETHEPAARTRSRSADVVNVVDTADQ